MHFFRIVKESIKMHWNLLFIDLKFCNIVTTVKSRFYLVIGRQPKIYQIEIINKIEIFYLLLVAEGTQ